MHIHIANTGFGLAKSRRVSVNRTLCKRHNFIGQYSYSEMREPIFLIFIELFYTSGVF